MEVIKVRPFKVQITETLQYQETIMAEDERDAIEQIKEKYRNCEIVLDETNHVSTEFDILERQRFRDSEAR